MRIAAFTLMVLFSAAPCLSSTTGNVSVGLGYTDNANLADGRFSPESQDHFLQASGLLQFKRDQHLFQSRISVVDFGTINTNDRLKLLLSDKIQLKESPWTVTPIFQFEDYNSGEAGYVDSAYDNLGWALKGDRLLSHRGLGIRLTPSIFGDYYPSLGSRADHGFRGELELSFSKNQVLGGVGADLGYVSSTDADFSRLTFSILGFVEWAFQEKWALMADLELRQTSFSSRTTGQVTSVTTARGRRIQVSAFEEFESYSLSRISTEIERSLSDSLEADLFATMGLSTTSQTSKSGFQDFSVNDLYGRLRYEF